ncbi:serine hydrolase domain-containing protein [Pedobacter glucosidilyticus]|uniref:serine hydrolase domain-containing protein n=1 Tax=Pedobacter glucosidilyticus TaxID=1122941 RepID=UPI0026EA8B57|nr:serine hydrolase domain-containing protein [Pedobacter glucosidilyticus]
MFKTIKYFSFIAVLWLTSACSEQITDKLVASQNLKKLQIEESNLDRIDSLLGSALINNWTAGVTALVAKNGQVFYDKGFGFRDRESKALMRPTDIFRIASMSKPIISVATMILVEQGKLKLDDPVSKYIPEFKNPQVLASFNATDTTYTTVPANKEITIKHLLTHTSGIGYGFADSTLKKIYDKHDIPDLATVKNITIEQSMKKLGTLPLGVQPDSKFYYGLSTDVLGYVIEVASGKKLDFFLKEYLFNPLGMNSTYFFLPPESTYRLAAMYSETKEGRLIKTYPISGKFNINYPIRGAKTYLSGGSGLCSTVEDYALFLQMILNKGTYGGKRILKAETIEMMSQNQIGNLQVGKNKFGLGFEIATEQGLANGAKVGKLSWSGAFNTMFWIDPQRNAIAILMTQVYPAIHKKEFYNKFETLVNDAMDRGLKEKK